MKLLKIIITLLLTVGITLPVFAEVTNRTAKITSLSGKVEVRPAEKEFIPAKTGMILKEGDIIRTYLKSSAILSLDGEEKTAIVEMKESSQLMISELKTNPEKQTENTLLDLAIGKILVKAKKLYNEKSRFEVKTPTSVVGVRGTTFAVEVEALK